MVEIVCTMYVYECNNYTVPWEVHHQIVCSIVCESQSESVIEIVVKMVFINYVYKSVR